jgi:hypothetical protein
VQGLDNSAAVPFPHSGRSLFNKSLAVRKHVISATAIGGGGKDRAQRNENEDEKRQSDSLKNSK